MRQGITTKYLGPTNSRGARCKAIARKADSWGKEMSLTQGWGYANAATEHCEAAKALATRLGWSGLWICGGKPEDDGYMYVNVADANYTATILGHMTACGGEDVDWFYVAEQQAAKAA